MKFSHIASLALAAALAVPAVSHAVPAWRGVRTAIQPDGTTLSYRMVGDEFGHHFVTLDNQLIVRQGDAFFFARPGDDTTPLVSTGILAADEAARTPEVKQMLAQIDRDAAVSLIEERAIANRARRTPENARIAVPTMATEQQRIPAVSTVNPEGIISTGEQHVPVVLVEYKDLLMKTENAGDYFHRMLNQDGFSDNGGTGCAAEYFRASSRGAYTPIFDVYGPVTLAQNKAYYGGNNAYGEDQKAEYMAIEAVKKLDATVDWSQYDYDGDGFIDNICIIYAGTGEATSNDETDVWPHAYYVYSGAGINVTVDGVKLDHYNCINEWVSEVIWGSERPDGIGTFCHEFSHILGLPDLYATAVYSDKTPGAWSVMDFGPYLNEGRTPPLHSSFEAYSLNWLTPTMINGDKDCSLDPLSETCDDSYAIQADARNEFFMFEARDRKGWDTYLPASGMIVWHIDFNATKWHNNTVNNTSTHHCVDLVEADNRAGDSSRAGDAFPGSRGTYDSFTFTSKPAFKPWSGQDLELPITKIERDDDTGRITFIVGEGDGSNSSAIDAIDTDCTTAPVEFFNLQGVRVSTPTPGSIVIRRQGSTVTKMIVK